MHLPGVGSNLQDRYEVTVVSELDKDFSTLQDVSFIPGDKNDPSRRQWLQDRTGLYATNGGTLAVIRRSAAAKAAGITADVVVDVAVGTRSGVPADQALALAQLVDTLPNLHFRGMLAYDGGAQHIKGYKARLDQSLARSAEAAATFERMKASGLNVEIFSGGGTGTYNIMPKLPGEFLIKLEGKDARGNAVAVSSWVWILGKGEAFWSGDESDRMSIIASKQAYQPGEVARLVPRSNLAGGR
jgi:hypothetical protein